MSETKAKLTGFRVSFFVALVMFVLCVVMMPKMLNSIVQEAAHTLEDRKLPFTPEGLEHEPTFTNLHVDLVAIDEPNRTATLRVNGFHTCKDEVKCQAYKERVVFFQVDQDDRKSETIPPSAVVEIPSSSEEVSKRITLPIRGGILTYPFDKYKLGLGVALQREYPDKSVHELTPAETRGKLILTLQEEVPRVEMTAFQMLDPASVKPLKGEFDYAYVAEMSFKRPPHIVIVVSIVTLLSLVIVVFTVVTRPFDTQILNVGATIFGIWGIRSLTLGGYPPEVTILDFILTTVVVLMLLVLTFRGMNHFHGLGKLTILPWALAKEPEPNDPMQECPECLTKVPVKATRCSACASPLSPGN
jgi:hypothetical protein